MLKLLLTGEGNMLLIPPPELNWPAGIDGFEPTVKDGCNKLTVPVSGSRIFDYPFAADTPGTYTLPAVEFSFFDPSRGVYETLTTRPVPVHILRRNETVSAPAPLTGSAKIKWWWFLPLALLLPAGFYWLAGKKRKTTPAAGTPEPTAAPVLVNVQPPLIRSEALLLHHNPRLFYETLHRELYTFLGNRLNLDPGSLRKKDMEEGFDRAGISLADRLEMEELLDDISAKVYSPLTDAARMQDDFIKAGQIIQRMQS